MTTDAEPIAPGLFTDIALLGGRCDACGETFFPFRSTCPKDHGDRVSRVELPTRGAVWSFSTQEYLPVGGYAGADTRESFEGFVFGYVDLPGACRVETRIDVPKAQARTLAAIGTEVEFTTVPFEHRDGRHLTTFAFRPVAAAAPAAEEVPA